jgi:two-component sensor histidine kinase
MGLLTALKMPVADVYITGELALQELAARMADHPEDVLPKFVDLAMEMTGGVAAGLSLYEENPAPGVFRWRYLRGTLTSFDGATTPRNFSPCGMTLDQNGPVLSSHPERVYDWISDAHIVLPEVLLVPLYLGSKVPLGTLWIVSDKAGHFDSGHARAMTELAAFVGIALRMQQSEVRAQTALAEQKVLVDEIGHRLKNVFAMAEGMIRISAKSAASKDELAKILSGRLHALASAHSLVQRDYSDVVHPPEPPDLETLLRKITRPHEHSPGAASRFSFHGPLTACGSTGLTGVALIFHELSTNSAKYGALDALEGQVDVRWAADAGKLAIVWSERGGPPIAAAPTTEGFGSKLLNDTVTRQFKGALARDWQPQGLTVTVNLPLEALAH